MIRCLLLMSMLAACASEPSDVVLGPFTGEPRAFRVDSITLASNYTTAREHGRDLDGDDNFDNQLGQAISTLSQQANITTHGAEMIASGAIHSTLHIRADDYVDDPSVAVIYLGSPSANATRAGGRFEDGIFTSNRAAAGTAYADAIARLPVFVDADPSDVPLVGLQLELVPDDTGYVVSVSGGVEHAKAIELTYAGLSQLIAANPEAHRNMMMLLDENHDHEVTLDEVRTNSLIESLLSPDVSVANRDAVSIGFSMHVVPCENESCEVVPTAAPTCFDRVRNGTESDVDCGGDCRSCKADEACTNASDCETAACDGGTCRAPSCSDGIRDGFETDVDCGGPCDACAIGGRCWSNGDCASGECGQPCTDPDPLNCIDWSSTYDTCRPAP